MVDFWPTHHVELLDHQAPRTDKTILPIIDHNGLKSGRGIELLVSPSYRLNQVAWLRHAAEQRTYQVALTAADRAQHKLEELTLGIA
jgi:hypothetical protein